ncbi:MAG TPA: sigma-70 family RNA polymerase sigma factor [Ktedonobacterales bacterium]|jgi:RNA polymerase sigma-70 factor (ECF subfamily)
MQRQPGITRVDESPAAALYQAHAPIILTYLRRHTPSREDAEDLLLEVFLAAFEGGRVERLPEGERIAWLRQVARHKLADHYRRTNQRLTAGLEDAVEIASDDEAMIPEQVALQHEEEQRLHDAISRLPDHQQLIVRLRFAEGMSSAQIANALNKNEGAVRMALSRALNLLRSLYGEY